MNERNSFKINPTSELELENTLDKIELEKKKFRLMNYIKKFKMFVLQNCHGQTKLNITFDCNI